VLKNLIRNVNIPVPHCNDKNSLQDIKKMFGKKKEKNQEPSLQRNAEYLRSPEDNKQEIKVENRPEKRAISAILSSDAEIEGTINFDGIMRIDGSVNGKISTDNGELVVGQSGIVNAAITTKSIVIDGKVDGTIIASDKVVLKQKAHLIGDLQAKSLVIEEGVVFVGRCNVNPKGVKFDNIAKKNQPKADHNQKKNFGANKGNTVLSGKTSNNHGS
jgi:cytoskeletal protein CcmA (bactofilin family)